MAEFDVASTHSVRNGHGKGIFKTIERHLRGLDTWQIVALAAGGVLVVDHCIAPKGMSFATKAYDKVVGQGHRLPPPPPPPIPAAGTAALHPALATAVAKGYFTGANRQAGWNRGMSDYGQYLGDVWQWHAHAGPWHGDNYPGYPWEE